MSEVKSLSSVPANVTGHIHSKFHISHFVNFTFTLASKCELSVNAVNCELWTLWNNKCSPIDRKPTTINGSIRRTYPRDARSSQTDFLPIKTTGDCFGSVRLAIYAQLKMLSLQFAFCVWFSIRSNGLKGFWYHRVGRL